MPVSVKICGINSKAALDAAIAYGASHVGFVFYPRSPRALSPDAAAALAAGVPAGIVTVGLFVDPDDAMLAAHLATARLDMLQLHGAESPARVAEIRGRFARPAMKAIAVAEAGDIARAADYATSADWVLFDAKPPPSMAGALPGGNALSFDWRLIGGARLALPWMLSGGLNASNLMEAVALTGARVVDVSSGVEDRPGIKNPDKIRDFLALAETLPRATTSRPASRASIC
jgi:phosphoribosylanthranilate isomerase